MMIARRAKLSRHTPHMRPAAHKNVHAGPACTFFVQICFAIYRAAPPRTEGFDARAPRLSFVQGPPRLSSRDARMAAAFGPNRRFRTLPGITGTKSRCPQAGVRAQGCSRLCLARRFSGSFSPLRRPAHWRAPCWLPARARPVSCQAQGRWALEANCPE